MKKVKFAGIWFISIALLLSSVTGWTQNAQVCHHDRVTVSFIGNIKKTVIESDIATLDTGFEEGGYKFYYHPFGSRLITTTLEGPFGKSTFLNTYIGPVFEDCCNCGDDGNAGYQLKIYSKDQNPTFPILEKFDKPILITEGFDVNYRLEKERFTFDRFQVLLDSVFDENDMDRPLPGETGLLRQLYNEGYDIALLLFKNPNIAIQTNAQVTLQALRWLEGHTVIREGTEPVVIGPSMGGLVTRYALQLAGVDFSTSGIRCRLFIAFDSPNRGAEIPMSIQALVNYFRDTGYTADVKFKNLQSPAASQLLLSLVGTGEHGNKNQTITDYETQSTEHGRFIKEINEPGFLAQIKNITHRFAGAVTSIHTAAIINGSKTGLDLNLPADFTYGAMEHFTLDLFLDTPTPDRLTRVFFGDRADKRFLRYNFQEPAFMENAPGGLRPTYIDTREELEKRDYGWNNGFDRRFVNHAFIPTLSGAGLLDVDINNNQSWYANIDTTTVKSIFDEVRAPVQNQGHVTITRENKQWFLELIHTWGPQEKPLFAITQITNSMDGFTRNPSINSDGTRIAFASDRDLTGSNADHNFEIFLFDTTTNTFTQITHSTGGVGNVEPSINSNGTRIAFNSDEDLTGGNTDHNSEIFLFDTTTNTFTQITHSTGRNGNFMPSINSDGTRIAFESDRDLTGGNADLNPNREIFLFNTTTNTFTQITNSTGGAGNNRPSINSDGTRIAFASDRDLTGGNADLNSEIFLFDTTISTLTQVTHTTGVGGGNFWPSINSDGTRIAFQSNRDLTGGNAELNPNREIFLFNTTTNTFTQITNSTGGAGNIQPSINSDGTRIAFMSDRDLTTGGNIDFNFEIYLFDTTTNKLTQVTFSTGGLNDEPLINSNGTRIAFISNRDLDLTRGNSDLNQELFLAVSASP